MVWKWRLLLPHRNVCLISHCITINVFISSHTFRQHSPTLPDWQTKSKLSAFQRIYLRSSLIIWMARLRIEKSKTARCKNVEWSIEYHVEVEDGEVSEETSKVHPRVRGQVLGWPTLEISANAEQSWQDLAKLEWFQCWLFVYLAQKLPHFTRSFYSKWSRGRLINSQLLLNTETFQQSSRGEHCGIINVSPRFCMHYYHHTASARICKKPLW